MDYALYTNINNIIIQNDTQQNETDEIIDNFLEQIKTNPMLNCIHNNHIKNRSQTLGSIQTIYSYSLDMEIQKKEINETIQHTKDSILKQEGNINKELIVNADSSLNRDFPSNDKKNELSDTFDNTNKSNQNDIYKIMQQDPYDISQYINNEKKSSSNKDINCIDKKQRSNNNNNTIYYYDKSREYKYKNQIFKNIGYTYYKKCKRQIILCHLINKNNKTCNKEIKANILATHLKTHHNHMTDLKISKFNCKFCDKSFLRKWNMQQHENIHRIKRPYVCCICNKDFNQKSTLNHHIKTHNRITNKE